MTRIKANTERPAITALMDIFEMSNLRAPGFNEVSDMLEMIGTHASIMDGAVSYEEEEVSHVHTLSIMDIKRK
ncbi:hypothetical protein [Methanococcoides alaskense]|uniref:Uncharacterized protein n=1 Tax=Methanococcoides alaskense TaxID=325778 RepID=A0AA90TZ89_9EURY|nr:hypothetical protein [Methanococcoides alaskense]MDA0524591.1 hypothetical protein [Methanococcoides alaskense]MDR6222279.1 hypothetical protein [Methanococcoides alaskense]